MKNKYSKIVKKVKGLLAIANDQKNDEECQSAFVLAQKLMIEYGINKSDVEDTLISEEINEESVTIFKKMFWWERQLSSIIGENFRVKVFWRNKTLDGEHKRKSKIVFYGLEKDLELAKEMYLLAFEALVYHSKTYISYYYEETGEARERYITESVKSSYISGFLEGLENRFAEQVAILQEEYSLLVMMPEVVEKSYEEMSKGFGSYSINTPPPVIGEAYKEGLKKGNGIDFTKSTIDTTDYSSVYNKIITYSQGATRDLLAKIIKIENETMILLNCYDMQNEDLPTFYKWELAFDYPFEFAKEKDIVRFDKNLVSFKKNYSQSFDELEVELGVQLNCHQN
ncbi:DUF2786 domain-containing protein [Carnobacterium gallinarum]|uniref:DUF2786 domain-containing protein n=1 Tax=Carnobacterium gallinarum TaxID=2749 RepID=UPI00055407C1|nr:DUF2786 domain-containing protein [Carnobacterium gallinarum]